MTYNSLIQRLRTTIDELNSKIRSLTNKKHRGGTGKKNGLFIHKKKPSSSPSVRLGYTCYNCGSADHLIGACDKEYNKEKVRKNKEKAESERKYRNNIKVRAARKMKNKRKREDDGLESSGSEVNGSSSEDSSDEKDHPARRSTKRAKLNTASGIQVPTLSVEVRKSVSAALKRKIGRVRAKRQVRKVIIAERVNAHMLEVFTDALAESLVSEGMEEAKEEKEMLDWLKGATIATLQAMSESIPTPTARLLKSTKTHPILSPIGLHEVGWKAEVAKLDGSSVGAIGPMIADTGAQFVCIPSNVAAKFVASGSTMFKATDGVIAQVSTDVEVEGIIYGDLVLHSPSGGTIVFKRMQCVVLPGDEILLSNWCLDQLGLQTYDVLNTAAAAAVVIDGNVRSQALIEDVEATEASIRRLHGLDAGQKIIHYFDPRSDRHELSLWKLMVLKG